MSSGDYNVDMWGNFSAYCKEKHLTVNFYIPFTLFKHLILFMNSSTAWLDGFALVNCSCPRLVLYCHESSAAFLKASLKSTSDHIYSDCSLGQEEGFLTEES